MGGLAVAETKTRSAVKMNKDEIVDAIGNLTVLELAELVKELRSKSSKDRQQGTGSGKPSVAWPGCPLPVSCFPACRVLTWRLWTSIMMFTVLRTDKTPGPGSLTPRTGSEAFEPCFYCFIEHDYPF